MNRADYYRRLAQDMAEARRRADLYPESSCWEEMERKLKEYQVELDSPTPPRPYRPRVPTASAYDIEYGRAIKERRKRGLSS